MIQNTHSIGVDQLLCQLKRNRTTIPTFKLPFDSESARRVLLQAVRNVVEMYGGEFRLTEDIDNIARSMANALTGDSRRFGMLLCGLPGNGKTTFVKALRQITSALRLPRDDYNRWLLKICSAKEIAQICRDDYAKFVDLCREPMLAIDDLGIEPMEVVSFGSREHPLVDMLYRRYDDRLYTVVTTNLTPQKISEIYGERVGNRLSEMVEKLRFKGSSFRKIA